MDASEHPSWLDLLSSASGSASDAIDHDLMSELIIPARLRDPNDHENKDDESTCTHKDDSIASSDNDFNLPIGGADDFMKVFNEDVAKDAGGALCHANDNGRNSIAKEVVLRLSKLPFHKVRSRSNGNSLTEEEREVMEEDNIGDSRRTQSARDAAKTHFSHHNLYQP